SGWWVVVGEANGDVRAWRFKKVERKTAAGQARKPQDPWRGPSSDTSGGGWRGLPGDNSTDIWRGPPLTKWTSSLSANSYVAAVQKLQRDIKSGALQQCNLTRVLSAPLEAALLAGDASQDGAPNSAPDSRPNAAALHGRLVRKHFAPLGG